MSEPASAASNRPTLASSRGAEFARIVSTGSYRPERVVTNDEICERLDSSDAWIRERTGIVSRRFAAPDQNVVDLALPAATQAIERAGLAPSQIDTVIFATITHMLSTPSAAAILASRVGAGRAVTFDLSTACAGFCHGLSVASDLIRGGSARNVLLVGAEKMTDIVSPTDRSTSFIFGDGAGAAVIGPSTTPAIGPTVWGSDADQWEALYQRQSFTEYRDAVESRDALPRTAVEPAAGDPATAGGGIEWPTLMMVGPKVFRWAVWEMSPVAQKAIDAAGIEAGDLAAFVPHQANLRIIDAMVKQLDLPKHVKVARNVTDTGNTSAASVPLALDRMITEGQVGSGDLVLLIGFGAGLSYSAQVVALP